MNAIIRHLNSGEPFVATLDDSGDVVMLSAALPIVDELGRDADLDAMTEQDWFDHFGGADVGPFEDDSDRKFWTADKIAVVQTI